MSNARDPGQRSKVAGRAANRCAVAGALSRVLADTYTLYLTSHNFYWNVTGPIFTILRATFMEQYTELWNALDPIAERIRSLGEWAPGSYASFESLTSLDDPPRMPPSAVEMMRILTRGHEAVVQTARMAFPVAQSANDQPTLLLLVRRIGTHEKFMWMLRSMDDANS